MDVLYVERDDSVGHCCCRSEEKRGKPAVAPDNIAVRFTRDARPRFFRSSSFYYGRRQRPFASTYARISARRPYLRSALVDDTRPCVAKTTADGSVVDTCINETLINPLRRDGDKKTITSRLSREIYNGRFNQRFGRKVDRTLFDKYQ